MGCPIVVESPHVWFPRTYYSQNRSLYRFPLDWDVVLKFPRRPTNNATDFNIMQRFKRFFGVSGVPVHRGHNPRASAISRGQRKQPLLVSHLSNVRSVTADKLAETTYDLEGNSLHPLACTKCAGSFRRSAAGPGIGIKAKPAGVSATGSDRSKQAPRGKPHKRVSLRWR